MRPNAGTAISYRPDIDGLRAIAVLAVMAFHLLPDRIKGGFVGVDIFFVISGFLISSIIYKELESGTFTIAGFYIRRIRRIYPALLVVLIFVSVAGWFILLPSQFVLLGKQIIGGSTFVANFVLWEQSGYFGQVAAHKPLLHLWSLGVEEQFYLMFPLICLVFYRTRSRKTLLTAFLVIAAGSMAINVAFVSRYRDASYFLPFSRLWELLLGAALSLFQKSSRGIAWESPRLSTWRTAIGCLGIAMLAIAIFGINQDDAFPGWWALLPTVGTALLIAAGQSSWINRKVLSLRPAVFIGLISYPLYLWHWPILSFLKIVNRDWVLNLPKALEFGIFSTSFLLAYLTYRFIELPIRAVKQKEQRRRGALWLLVSVAMAGAFGVVIVGLSGFPARWPASLVALDHDFGTQEAAAFRDGTCLLRPDQGPSSFSSSCLDPIEEHSGQPLIFVWGDSHAADLLPGLRALQAGWGIRLAQYTASLCAPILGLDVPLRPACRAVNDADIERIRELKPAVVVLSAIWDEPFITRDPSFAAEFENTIASVKAAGVRKVVVIGDAPMWSVDVPLLLTHEVRINPFTPVPHRLSRSYLVHLNDTQVMETAQEAGAVFVPIIDRLCDQKGCLVTTGPAWSDIVTFDVGHFTVHGSTIVAPLIWPSIMPDHEHPTVAKREGAAAAENKGSGV